MEENIVRVIDALDDMYKNIVECNVDELTFRTPDQENTLHFEYYLGNVRQFQEAIKNNKKFACLSDEEKYKKARDLFVKHLRVNAMKDYGFYNVVKWYTFSRETKHGEIREIVYFIKKKRRGQ